jgi:2-keto-4-pentenoate hydratase/2-oxohepta-3-ene-1,7-dioic acid hydratase in catechol pathway
MRYARVVVSSGPAERVAYARLDGDRVVTLSDAPWLGGTPTDLELSRDACALEAPVEPRTILCVGRNYAAHAKELGNEVPKEPLLFLTPASSVIGPDGAVELPSQSQRVEHEAELAVVIGAHAWRGSVTRENALSYVFGYTCACDVTARDLQKTDGQWTRAKGFDTFCPIGPWIETELDPSDVRVQCRVNGQTRQDGRTSAMMFDVPTILAYVSTFMTLRPGDVVLTGTPEGVGPLAAGDALEVEIEGLGTLAVTVK